MADSAVSTRHMATIGEISSVVTSGSTPLGGRKRYAGAGVPFIRSMNVLPGRLEIDPNVCIPPDVHRKMSRSRVMPGDVLLNITGEGTLGRAAAIPERLPEANINQHVCLIRPIFNLVDSRYLAYVLNARQTQEQMTQLQTGATRAALNHRLVKTLRVPLPPLGEQRRIVARIQEIAHRVEEATGLRRAALQDAQKLPPSARSHLFQSLDGRVQRVPLGKIARFINGRAFKPNEWASEGVPIIRIQNLHDPALPFNRYAGEIPERFHVRAGDLLVSWAGALVSIDAFIWNGEFAYLNQHIFRAEEDSARVNRAYLFEAILYTLGELRSKVVGGTGQIHVRKGILEEQVIPIPPLDQQQAIVGLLEGIRARSERLKERQRMVQAELEALMPAVLEKAFRGEL